MYGGHVWLIPIAQLISRQFGFSFLSVGKDHMSSLRSPTTYWYI